MVNDGSDSTKWLATLLGQAWAPQPPGVTSDRIQKIAERGLHNPKELGLGDIQEISASVLANAVQSRNRTALGEG